MGDLRIFCAGVSVSVRPAQTIQNILFNVVDNAIDNNAVRVTKALIKLARPGKLILDSSGYQILQGEVQHKRLTTNSDLPIIHTKDRLNISPFHVVTAAVNIQPDIMIGLDFPIRKLSTIEDQEKEYLFKSHYNATWASETALLREICCPHIQFFLPIQCYSLENLDHYMTLIGDIPYDGISMPVRNLSLKEVALFLMRFHQMGVKKVHILGTTSFKMIALCSYFARHFFDMVSLDSTTWRLAAEHNQYHNPLDLSNIGVGNNSSGVDNRNMICECPFCINRTFEFIRNLPHPDRIALVRSHNFYVIETVAEDLYNNATSIPVFEAFLETRTRNTRIIKELIESISSADTNLNSPVVDSLWTKAA